MHTQILTTMFASVSGVQRCQFLTQPTLKKTSSQQLTKQSGLYVCILTVPLNNIKKGQPEKKLK